MSTTPSDLLLSHLSVIKTANFVTKAISNPFRQKIISTLLLNGKLPVNELCQKLQAEQSIMSQHLAILKQANLVSAQRNGKSILYTANEEQLHRLIESVLLLAQVAKPAAVPQA